MWNIVIGTFLSNHNFTFKVLYLKLVIYNYYLIATYLLKINITRKTTYEYVMYTFNLWHSLIIKFKVN